MRWPRWKAPLHRMTKEPEGTGKSGPYSMEIQAFGLRIHPWSMAQTLAFIQKNLLEKDTDIVQVVVNAAKVVDAQKDPVLRAAINESHLVNVDGLPVVWVLRMLGHRVPERVAGVDLFERLLHLAAEKGYRPYFLGARHTVLARMIQKIQQQFPTLDIAGSHHGYFQPDEEKEVANHIRTCVPDLLFIGIPSPQKELFLNRWSGYLKVPFAMGVGGSFDVLAGKTRRAPRWMQKTGLEWFFRILQEPGRLWKRYARTNILFIGLSLREIAVKIMTRDR